MPVRTCAINTEYKLGSRIGSVAARGTPFVLARPNLQSPVLHITKTKAHIVQEYVLKQPANRFLCSGQIWERDVLRDVT